MRRMRASSSTSRTVASDTPTMLRPARLEEREQLLEHAALVGAQPPLGVPVLAALQRPDDRLVLGGGARRPRPITQIGALVGREAAADALPRLEHARMAPAGGEAAVELLVRLRRRGRVGRGADAPVRGAQITERGRRVAGC